MDIQTRAEAKINGDKKYFTGKPCPHGHTAERYTSSGHCCECAKEVYSNQRLPASELHHYFRYEPETGKLFWTKNSCVAMNFRGREINTKCSHKNSDIVYYRVNLRGKFYLVHRIVWALFYGNWPSKVIDHKDGDGANNKIGNLRDVHQKINTRNCALSKNNTTGANGVWRNRSSYVAEIMIDRKKISIGSYKTIEEAAAARKKYEHNFGFTKDHGIRKHLSNGDNNENQI